MKPFQREKMRSLVLHVLATSEPGQVSAAAMNLVLFLADLFHFGSTGETISGETYLKGRAGPVAKHLAAIRTQLIAESVIGEESVHTDRRGRGTVWFVRRDTERQPEIRPLSARELKALTSAIEHAFGISSAEAPRIEACQASDTIDIGEPIDLEAALRKSALPAAA